MSMVVLAAEGSVDAGWLALIVIGSLAIAVFFLYRSMTKHLRRVPASFDPPAARADDNDDNDDNDGGPRA